MLLRLTFHQVENSLGFGVLLVDKIADSKPMIIVRYILLPFESLVLVDCRLVTQTERCTHRSRVPILFVVDLLCIAENHFFHAAC